jgi:hypothetical protein
MLEGGTEGNANGGETHEEAGLREAWVLSKGWAGEGQRHRAELYVLVLAVGWDGAGHHCYGEDAGGVQWAIGLEIERLVCYVDEDGGDTEAVLGHDVLGQGRDLVTRRLSNDGAHLGGEGGVEDSAEDGLCFVHDGVIHVGGNHVQDPVGHLMVWGHGTV